MTGNFEYAGKLFGLLRQTEPEHPDVLHDSDVLAHQRGRNDEGIALTRRSLEPHGRDTPSRRYVERVLQDAHFSPTIVLAELRMESGVLVRGRVVRATAVDGEAHA